MTNRFRLSASDQGAHLFLVQPQPSQYLTVTGHATLPLLKVPTVAARPVPLGASGVIVNLNCGRQRRQRVNSGRSAGPVTENYVVCDCQTVSNAHDLSVNATSDGSEYRVSFSSAFKASSLYRISFSDQIGAPVNQEWAYVSRQQVDEALVIKCFDSRQGRSGISMFAPHAACSEVFGEQTTSDVENKPRVSIEARMIVLS
ncbi:hypothetical protein P7C70_g8225, partial [Phenoliferia sp. Uapishka_3]